MLTPEQIRDIAAAYSKDPHHFEFEANDFIAAARAIDHAARREALEQAAAAIRELRESHAIDAEEPLGDPSCDFQTAWETAEERIRALVGKEGG